MRVDGKGVGTSESLSNRGGACIYRVGSGEAALKFITPSSAPSVAGSPARRSGVNRTYHDSTYGCNPQAGSSTVSLWLSLTQSRTYARRHMDTSRHPTDRAAPRATKSRLRIVAGKHLSMSRSSQGRQKWAHFYLPASSPLAWFHV